MNLLTTSDSEKFFWNQFHLLKDELAEYVQKLLRDPEHVGFIILGMFRKFWELKDNFVQMKDPSKQARTYFLVSCRNDIYDAIRIIELSRSVPESNSLPFLYQKLEKGNFLPMIMGEKLLLLILSKANEIDETKGLTRYIQGIDNRLLIDGNLLKHVLMLQIQLKLIIKEHIDQLKRDTVSFSSGAYLKNNRYSIIVPENIHDEIVDRIHLKKSKIFKLFLIRDSAEQVAEGMGKKVQNIRKGIRHHIRQIRNPLLDSIVKLIIISTIWWIFLQYTILKNIIRSYETIVC